MISLFNRIKISLVYRYRFRYFKVTNFFWNSITKLLISNKRKKGVRNSLYVFVPVWGEKHIDWFFKYTFPSLLKSKNFPLTSQKKKIKIFFFTKDNEFAVLDERMKNHSSNYEYSIFVESNFKDKARDMMSNFFIYILKACIEDNALLLIAQPDLIFSNGSIYNLVTLSDDKGVSIAVPSARVSFESIEKSNFDISSEYPNLVDLIINHPHESVLNANEDNDENTTLSGLSTKKLSTSLAVISNNACTFLSNPTKSDLSFFNRRPGFNIIDKVWQDMLFRESRLKIIGSSDIATIVELTNDDDKYIALSPNMRLNDFYLGFPPFMQHSNVVIGLWRKS